MIETDEAKSGADGKNSSDTSSPYYLHPSDNPGQVYVSELLNEGNYAEWVNDMANALFAKNKIGFVDGTLSMPSVDSSELSAWMRCNAMVKGWLKSSMDKDVRISVRYAKSAREIWTDLEERFGKGNAPRVYELRRQVAMMRQDRSSAPTYYTKLKSLWDEIETIMPMPKCECGKCTCDIEKQLVEMKERDRLYEFLMGLDEASNTIKTQILSMKPTPRLGQAYHLVAEDEQQRQVSAMQRPVIESAAFQVRTDKVPRDGKREKPKCNHCQKLGHTEDRCYELIGFPEDWKKGSRDKRERRTNWGEKKGMPRAAQK
ncbi:uncharacterized protein LOC129302557 [Prosopis cineraria]|uniref:uncharacterized protein LOC129293072 n=1 Tax=Prosopis cineraria TaxID=364024 RepID=UPI00240FB911|nr:uncharacterized protein LOC129293072 [Prosopis cineraria]XP_054797468.1 uncharacterized protein LOC129302557 [Prosopis cineraria]